LRYLIRRLIGIDCGATNTEVIVYSYRFVKEKPVPGKSASFRFPAINYNLLGAEKTIGRLASIIKKSAGAKLHGNVDYITAGISGARHEEDRKRIKSSLQKALKFKNIEIYPDTLIALSAAFEPGTRNCGILVAGTGSVLYYVNNNGKVVRAGGWGRYIGDEGGGYWIAKAALHMVTQYYDGRASKSIHAKKLAEKLDKELNINRHTIINEVYHKGFEISKVTKLVFDCAESGDSSCRQIIKEAAENLSMHFNALKNAKAAVALCGSLFSREKLLEYYLRKVTGTNYPRVKLVKSEHTPAWGAVKVGAGKIGLKL
jgi:N-acetylglucosamine kinase-like BadF-type ATPase